MLEAALSLQHTFFPAHLQVYFAMPRPFVAHNVGRFRYDHAAASTPRLDKSTAGDSKCEEGSRALEAQHGELASRCHDSPPRYHSAGASHHNSEAGSHEIEDLLRAILSGSTVNSGNMHGSVKIVINGPVYIGLRGPVDNELCGRTDIEIRGPIEIERPTTSSENPGRQPRDGRVLFLWTTNRLVRTPIGAVHRLVQHRLRHTNRQPNR
ncbi:unnamed protein product [Cyclocybe aegerita]|uniref:Uncharacterized protein n=1 Tax=Cyclocybe aegerita TaxID=1973307 RepID=A0A8S0WU15_CYCAE|nr:unnamed protein product [Cyclocybe aegerita]